MADKKKNTAVHMLEIRLQRTGRRIDLANKYGETFTAKPITNKAVSPTKMKAIFEVFNEEKVGQINLITKAALAQAGTKTKGGLLKAATESVQIDMAEIVVNINSDNGFYIGADGAVHRNIEPVIQESSEYGTSL